MRTRMGFIGLSLAIAAGCRSPTESPAQSPVLGEWLVVAFDGATPAAGELQIGIRTPSQYKMILTQPATDSFFSAGRYTWDHAVVVLTDSGSGQAMTGTLDATQTAMSLLRGEHTVRLWKQPLPCGGGVGQCAPAPVQSFSGSSAPPN